jgi:drug/metabolite transporter (DMT)-like permease
MSANSKQAATLATTESSTVFSTYAKLICVPLIWGGTFIAGRIVSGQLPPAVGALGRYLIATVVLLAFWFASEARDPNSKPLTQLDRKEWLFVLGLGATGILIYNLGFFAALGLIPASRTAVFVALNPAFTIVLAVLLFRERMVWTRWLGVALALVGVWIVITRGDLLQLFQSIGKGELLMLMAVAAWVGYTLIGRQVLKTMSPLKSTLWASIFGTLMLSFFAAPDFANVKATQFTMPVVLSLIFLGALGTAVAFVWYYQGVQRLGTSRTVVFNNLVPIFGVLLGWLILDEAISISLLVGGSIAVAGIFLVNRVPAAST